MTILKKGENMIFTAKYIFLIKRKYLLKNIYKNKTKTFLLSIKKITLAIYIDE